MLLPFIRAARPHQWIKNLFVLAPLVFARRIDDVPALWHAAAAAGFFCILSSAVYLLNDIVDVEKDRAHPVKRRRPIASGALPLPMARAMVAALAVTALAGSVLLSWNFAVAAATYFVLNLAYSFALKRVPVVDVLCIALGFLLRVLAGAFAIPVQPSPWLLGTTLLLSSMLGFGKRAHELRLAGNDGTVQRDVLGRYNLGTLKVLMGGLAIATIAAYSLYTQSVHALEFFGTRTLAATIPFVAFGILRFLWRVFTQQDAESPTDSMLRDKLFLANLLAYAIAIVVIIYGGRG